MGMGYGANFVDVIELTHIKKVGKCKKLFDNFAKKLKEAGTDLDSFAQSLSSNGYDVQDAVGEVCGDEKVGKSLVSTYEALLSEFREKTGLVLSLDYHSSEDDGDRYDEIDGSYWEIRGFHSISPAGLAAQEKWGIQVESRGFVSFG